jgi:hypothetical protein
MRVVKGDAVPTDRAGDVQPGDSVIVHLAGNLNAAMFGEVISVRAERLRLMVYSLDGAFEIDGGRDRPMDVVLPWSSVGFLRHSNLRIEEVD